MPFGFIAFKDFFKSYSALPSLDYEQTWCRSSQKRVVCT